MKQAAALFVVALLIACGPRAGAGSSAGDAVREQEAAFIAAVASEDAAASAAFYAPDAQLMTPGAAPATTPEAVLAAYQETFADPNGSLTFSTENVITPSSGDYAVTEGPFTITFSDAQSQTVSVSGRYMTVWRRQDDGGWKIVRDMASPGPAAAAP